MQSKSSVAIVDDEEYMVKTYEILLKRRNIPLSFVAYSGEEAIEKFTRSDPRPGVVIIDYRLPSMSGLEVMRSIKEMEPGTKIIFISGDENCKKASLDEGANIFLKKPASINEITQSVNSLLTG